MKIVKSIFLIIVFLFCIVSASYAVWTDQAILSDNNFRTGSISLTTTPATELFNATDIYPGWNETKTLNVKNDGTIPLKYQFLTTKSGTSTVLYNSDFFLLKVGTTSGGDDLYNGSMKNATFTNTRLLNAGNSEDLFLTVSLSNDATDDLQNKSATVNFVFNASS